LDLPAHESGAVVVQREHDPSPCHPHNLATRALAREHARGERSAALRARLSDERRATSNGPSGPAFGEITPAKRELRVTTVA
jgi:hypothetical protein